MLAHHVTPPAFTRPHAPPHAIHVRAYRFQTRKAPRRATAKPAVDLKKDLVVQRDDDMEHYDVNKDSGMCLAFFLGLWAFAGSKR